MSEISELYQEMILDHNRNPRNFHSIPDADRKAEGYNPLCGDEICLFLKLDDDVIRDISFQGSGCAISKASCSLMTALLKGKNKEEAQMLFEKFHKMVTGQPGAPVDPALGKLEVFAGVCEYPSRVKCATLAWHTLKSALEGKTSKVTTEGEEES